MADYLENLTTLPFAPLGIIAMPGCEEIGKKIGNFGFSVRKTKKKKNYQSKNKK